MPNIAEGQERRQGKRKGGLKRTANSNNKVKQTFL